MIYAEGILAAGVAAEAGVRRKGPGHSRPRLPSAATADPATALRVLRAFVVKNSHLGQRPDGITETPRHARGDGESVWPSQTHPPSHGLPPSQGLRRTQRRTGPTWSNLVRPSQTMNFSLSGGASMRVTRSIRVICVIRGRNFSPSVPIRVHLWLPPSWSSLTTSHPVRHSLGEGGWPLVTTSPTQYGLIRPNTALNCFGGGIGGKTCLAAELAGLLWEGKACRLWGRLTVDGES